MRRREEDRAGGESKSERKGERRVGLEKWDHMSTPAVMNKSYDTKRWC